jgi:hypothetical protein
MKNLILLLALITTGTVATAQSKWNIGIGTGATTNLSKYDSGNEEANALFENNPYQSHNLTVNFRYKISEKLAFQTGLGFSEIGYSYSIAKDYSLLKPMECNDDDIRTGTFISDIPAMIILNTPVNCSKVRFIFGAGFSIRGVNNSWDNQSAGEIKSYEAANSNDTYITAQSGTQATVAPAAIWMIGVERMLKKGNSLSFAFQGTQGFTTISESTVNYTVANKDYTHTFINRGSLVTFSLAYNFMQFGSRNALKTSVN